MSAKQILITLMTAFTFVMAVTLAQALDDVPDQVSIDLMAKYFDSVEQLIEKIPGTYKAYTYIDIHSNTEKIWKNVTRVKTIEKAIEIEWPRSKAIASISFPIFPYPIIAIFTA